MIRAGSADPERRAARLLRVYPPAWRSRYGDEFQQYLIDEMGDRPYSAARTVDVLRGGLMARAAQAGLGGGELDPEAQLRAGLGVLALALAGFLSVGVAVWAQLTVGWQWSAPTASATRTGMLVMSVTMLGFGLIAVLAAAPVIATLAVALGSGRRRAALAPVGLTVIGAAVLVAGSLHFGHGWPGTGGHPWAGRALVPGAVARFCWAATLWITSYWAHPGALSSFPAAEVAWMIASPLAIAALVVGIRRTLRQIELSARALAYESRLGLAAAALMSACLAGAASWVVSGGPAPHALYRVGAIDVLALAVMATALLAACHAARRNLELRRLIVARR